MFDIDRKQYIFKLSSGRTINIYHKQTTGICFSTLNRKGTWYAPAVIVKNAVPGFGAYLDKNDVVHILYQDYNGELTYTYYCNSSWNTVPVAIGRNPAHKIKNLCLTGSDNYIFAFYTIEYTDISYLYFQIGTIKGNLLEPHVIDVIDTTVPCFCPAIDKYGNASVFYLQKNNRVTVPGFRTYDLESSQWGYFMQYPSIETGDKPGILSYCFDTHNNMHLLFNRSIASGNELHHTVRSEDQVLWQQEIGLSSSPLPFKNAALVIQDSLLVAYWSEDGNIHYCTSRDYGITWMNQEAYTDLKGKHVYCMSYSSNHAAEEPYVSGLCIPGNYVGGFSLAFYRDEKLMQAAYATDILTGKSADEIKGHEVSDTGINKEDEKHTPPYCSAAFCKESARYYDKLFTEIEKLDIRQTLLETEISNIKKQLSEEKKHLSTNTVPGTVRPEAGKQEAVKPEAVKQEDAKPEAIEQEETAKVLPKNMPLMTGAGFSFVTPEYLKSLKKHEPGGTK